MMTNIIITYYCSLVTLVAFKAAVKKITLTNMNTN